jgi:hypothetical protein
MWDIRDEDWLLFVVDEEVQHARRRIKVSLQHHSGAYAEILVSGRAILTVPDRSGVATESRSIGEIAGKKEIRITETAGTKKKKNLQ